MLAYWLNINGKCVHTVGQKTQARRGNSKRIFYRIGWGKTHGMLGHYFFDQNSMQQPFGNFSLRFDLSDYLRLWNAISLPFIKILFSNVNRFF